MLAKSSSLPQWLSDAKTTHIVDANDAALDFWRYTRERFIGMPATQLLFEDEVPLSEGLRKRNLWGETGPWRCRRGDGSQCYMVVRWQEIEYEGRRCHFVFPVKFGESLSSLEPFWPPIAS